jgi:hypothetical protein
VVFSNKSDPFSASNAPQALPILDIMHQAGVEVLIQTKGGPAAYEALDFMPPSVWYVTMTTLDPDLSRQLEPGAPLPDERLALIQAAVDKGHSVILGFNPYVEHWQPNPAALIEKAKKAGAYGVWIERLHFTTRQIKRMDPWQRAAIGDELLQRGRKKKKSQAEKDAFYAARQAVVDAGLSLYSKAQPIASGFFDEWDKHYAMQFPTWQTFINMVNFVYGENYGLVTFNMFLEYAIDHLPQGTWPIDSYFGATAHNLWRTHKVPAQLTYAQVLALAWSEPRLSVCPARLPSFAMAGKQREDGQWIGYVDEQGLPVLVWGGGKIFTDYWVDVTTLAENLNEKITEPSAA